MEFREFLKEEEELDLFAAAVLEEGLGGVLRGLGGFGGNLISQTGRGAYNLAGGLGRTAGGIGSIGLGAVQGLTGGGDAAKNLASGARDVLSGLGGSALGAAQVAGAASGLTPALRAVQAANEKGFFTPMSKRRTGLQRAMGLNSWDPEGDSRKDSEDHLRELKVRFAKARERGDRRGMRLVRAQIEKHHPEAYERIRARAMQLKADHEGRRWREIGSRVGDVVPPDEFLRGLSAEN